MGYMDLFAETWKAFTDYPIIRLHKYDKKTVSLVLVKLSVKFGLNFVILRLAFSDQNSICNTVSIYYVVIAVILFKLSFESRVSNPLLSIVR
jgi:tRNA U34 5-methylaminomethyl-2-thiouridine-forming methyltransferase MnmC